MLITMSDCDGLVGEQSYELFKVGNTKDKYKLTVSIDDQDASAGDSINDKKRPGSEGDQNNMFFTARDADNDNLPEGNCAEVFKGYWQVLNYKFCLMSLKSSSQAERLQGMVVQ